MTLPPCPAPRGTWGTVLLPVRDDDSIDFTAVEAQVDALLRHGVDGVYTNGTAGEFFAQDEDEFDQLSRIVADACRAAG
ncbi:MAG: dihydrodipicolinate synthase family protein, partial [Planctomycetota bacterium]